MRTPHYLASLTDTVCPGRFAVETKAPPTENERGAWAQEQADIIVKTSIALFERGRSDLESAYDHLLKQEISPKTSNDDLGQLGKEIFNRVCHACYPYLYISERTIRETLAAQRRSYYADPLMLAPRDHMSTIAEPKIMQRYFFEQTLELLENGYSIEVGLSILPMPVTYAVEGSPKARPVSRLMIESIQSFFPVPSIADVEDSVVDGRYKRRDESTVVNREYQFFTSSFWELYQDFLRNGRWKSDLVKAERDWAQGQTYSRLLDIQSEALKSGYFNKCESIPKDRNADLTPEMRIVAPRDRSPMLTSSEVHHAYRVPKPLAYFDALRTQFSFSRLLHYTGTSAEYFRPFVLLVNHPDYIREFVLRAICEIYRDDDDAPDSGKPRLVVTPSERATPGGREFDKNAVLQLFSTGEANGEDKGLASLQTVSAMLHSRQGLHDIDDPEMVEAYEHCWSVADRIVEECDAPMPAFHFLPRKSRARPSSNADYRRLVFQSQLPGITLINSGVGPSNIKAITDHIAPLRPRCWMTIGRCGGLRKHQHIGDYVIATGYVRRDGVLDRDVPLDAPVKTTRPVLDAWHEAIDYHLKTSAPKSTPETINQRAIRALKGGFSGVFKEETTLQQLQERYDRERDVTRYGTVISTFDRTWETSPTDELFEEFEKYRAVAIDMESATLAANGYRYRVHHGACLCVSDRPLHGAVRVRALEDAFYLKQTARHLDVAIDAFRWLENDFAANRQLAFSRELRGSDDPPWR